MKKIIVLGAGAIGSLFAAFLSKKHSIELIGRKPHVDLINNKGLFVSGLINKSFKIKAKTKIGFIPDSAVILLTTKAQDSKKAIVNIRHKLKKDTIIVCLQNGLGSDDLVREIVSCKVIRAVTKMSAEFTKPGKVNFTGSFITYVGQDGKIIADIFNDAGIKTELIEDIRYELWKKLIFNCVINGLGSILNVRNNQLNDHNLSDLKQAIVGECLAVAEKAGVKISQEILEKVNGFITQSTNLNSTLQDLLKHKQTEIEFLNGAVVRLGRQYDVSTPINKTIYHMIKFLEKRK